MAFVPPPPQPRLRLSNCNGSSPSPITIHNLEEAFWLPGFVAVHRTELPWTVAPGEFRFALAVLTAARLGLDVRELAYRSSRRLGVSVVSGTSSPCWLMSSCHTSPPPLSSGAMRQGWSRRSWSIFPCWSSSPCGQYGSDMCLGVGPWRLELAAGWYRCAVPGPVRIGTVAVIDS
jgi:hypothetical protein